MEYKIIDDVRVSRIAISISLLVMRKGMPMVGI